MNISSYADLLTAARQQPEPQRLLVASGRDGRPWLVGVRPMGAGAPDS